MQSDSMLVLGVTRHDFKDESSGREVKGINVFCLVDDYRNDDSARGYIPAKFSGDHTAFQDFQELPGYYDVLLIHRASQGKMVARVKAATFLQAADLAPTLQQANA